VGEGPVTGVDADSLVTAMRGLLSDLRGALQGADPVAFRKVIRLDVAKVRLQFRSEKKSVRSRHTLIGGQVDFLSGHSDTLRVG